MHRYAKVIFESEDRIDTKDTGVARQMINAMNAHMPFFHYSLCPDCNGIEVHASLYVPTKGFPRKKFKKLFNVLLKEIMTVLPLMIKIIRKGGTFDDLKEVLQGKHSDSTAETFNQTDGGENEEETVR